MTPAQLHLLIAQDNKANGVEGPELKPDGEGDLARVAARYGLFG